MATSEDSSFVILIQDGIDDLEVAEDIERNLTSKGKENRKYSI